MKEKGNEIETHSIIVNQEFSTAIPHLFQS
jgi:hypothetical protein